MKLERNQIYRCDSCGVIIDILHKSLGNIVCCDVPMCLVVENTEDAVVEKHLPVVEKISTGIKIKVGEIIHPMEEKHFIEWIEVITVNNETKKKFLNPNEKPEAEFCIENFENIVSIRSYCNLHGLWKSENYKKI